MKRSRKILIIADKDTDRVTLGAKLQNKGYEVKLAGNCIHALRVFHKEQPDMIVTNIALSGKMNFLTFCRRIRDLSNLPIITLTTQAIAEDKLVEILNAGVDYCFDKTVSSDEIVARIKFYLPNTNKRLYEIYRKYDDDYLNIDLDSKRVFVQGTPILLTIIEFKLLTILFENVGRIVTPREILDYVWGQNFTDDLKYPQPFVARLRVKIEPDASEPIYIVTVPRVGYRFVEQETT